MGFLKTGIVLNRFPLCYPIDFSAIKQADTGYLVLSIFHNKPTCDQAIDYMNYHQLSTSTKELPYLRDCEDKAFPFFTTFMVLNLGE